MFIMRDGFEFGKNWSSFVARCFSEETIVQTQRSLCAFLGLPSLEGLRFLDIGSGSGLSSLAAWRSGAERVTSFDYDPKSVETTKKPYEFSGKPAN